MKICELGFFLLLILIFSSQSLFAGVIENPDLILDKLANFDTSSKIPKRNKLTTEQLVWGETQLRRLLQDRPIMVPYIYKEDDLWVWMVHQLAGEYVEGGIWWDARDPKPLWDAMYYGAWHGKKARIQVTKNFCMYKVYYWGEPKTGPVLWYETFYEIFNLISLKPVYTLDVMASQGKINKEDYILRRMLTERETGEAAHDFFHKVWIPHCEKLSLPYEDEFLIKVYGEGIKVLTREEVLQTKFRPENFNYKYFADQYDRLSGKR